MRFKILTVVSIKVSVLWDVTPYTLVKTWCIGGTHCFHLQCRNVYVHYACRMSL